MGMWKFMGMYRYLLLDQYVHASTKYGNTYSSVQTPLFSVQTPLSSVACCWVHSITMFTLFTG